MRRPFASLSGRPLGDLILVLEEECNAAIAFDKEYHERAIARVVAKCEAHKIAREEELKTLRAEVARLREMMLRKGNP